MIKLIEEIRNICSTNVDVDWLENDASEEFARIVELIDKPIQKKKYYVGVSILNDYEVEAKNKEEAEETIRNYSNEELLEDHDFNINYIDEIKE